MAVRASATPDGKRTLGLRQLFPPPERTVPRMLLRQAERHGQRRLVSIGGMTLTYAEASEAAAGYAATLAAAGIKSGDRVALICGNRAELLLTILGCAWLGAIAVPINVASRGAQLEHILSNCGARLLVVERELAAVTAGTAPPFNTVQPPGTPPPMAEQRTRRNMSQAELAKSLGVSRQTIILIENGQYLPSLPLAFTIARFFGMTVDAMFRQEYGSPKTWEKAPLEQVAAR